MVEYLSDSLPTSVMVLTGQIIFLFLAVTRQVPFFEFFRKAGIGALIFLCFFVFIVADSERTTWTEAFWEALYILPFLLAVAIPAAAAASFREALLPRSHEPLTLYMTIISTIITVPVGLALFAAIGSSTTIAGSLMVATAALLYTTIICYIYFLAIGYTFSHNGHTHVSRGILNTWYMCCLCGVTAYFAFPLFADVTDHTVAPLTAIIAGYFITQVYIIAFYLLLLIPIPGKHQSFQERWRNTKEHFRDIASRFSTDQYHSSYIILMIAAGIFTAILLLIPYEETQRYASALIAAVHIISW
ncbi:MAG: hypothetical protein RI911_934, partial [Candidatus Parcubacteria bacterium]